MKSYLLIGLLTLGINRGFSQTYISLNPSLTNDAGTIPQKANLSLEIGTYLWHWFVIKKVIKPLLILSYILSFMLVSAIYIILYLNYLTAVQEKHLKTTTQIGLKKTSK